MKFSTDIAAAITAGSTRFGVDASFLAAIIQQESSGNTWAMRYEPLYSYLWDIEQNAPFRGALNPASFPAPDFVSGQTEWMAQKTSWGVAQVIGAVARQFGFAGKYLNELGDPSVGAEYGARLIAQLMKKYAELSDVASAYNAGHATADNITSYVTPVMANYATFRQSGF